MIIELISEKNLIINQLNINTTHKQMLLIRYVLSISYFNVFALVYKLLHVTDTDSKSKSVLQFLLTSADTSSCDKLMLVTILVLTNCNTLL